MTRPWAGPILRLFFTGPSGLDPSDTGLEEYEDIVFFSQENGAKISGWFIPSRGSQRCVILAHGGFGDRANPKIGLLEIAKRLHDKGYNVLMFDFQEHGKSGGKWTSVGPNEAKDILTAFDWLVGRGFNPGSIGILGFSMGAVAALLAASEDLRITAVVSDSAFARYRWVKIGIREWLILKLLLGKMEMADPLDAVADARAKMFFISGDEDQRVVPGNAFVLFEASGGEKWGNQIWIASRAGHTRSFKVNPEEYISKVIAFFGANLTA